MYGIRYIVIAAGGPEEAATDEDMDALKEMLDRLTWGQVTTTILSERTSNKLTLSLLQERGVL